MDPSSSYGQLKSPPGIHGVHYHQSVNIALALPIRGCFIQEQRRSYQKRKNLLMAKLWTEKSGCGVRAVSEHFVGIESLVSCRVYSILYLQSCCGRKMQIISYNIANSTLYSIYPRHFNQNHCRIPIIRPGGAIK